MPAKPTVNKSRVRKGASDEVRTTLIGCVTEGGIYYVEKVVIPTSIVQGTEDAELDAELDAEPDDWAKEWNGKVLEEKKVRAYNYIRLERSAVNRNGKVFPYVNFEEFEGGAHGVTNNEVIKGGVCRNGSSIY
jgi:hypothetical protein